MGSPSAPRAADGDLPSPRDYLGPGMHEVLQDLQSLAVSASPSWKLQSQIRATFSILARATAGSAAAPPPPEFFADKEGTSSTNTATSTTNASSSESPVSAERRGSALLAPANAAADPPEGAATSADAVKSAVSASGDAAKSPLLATSCPGPAAVGPGPGAAGPEPTAVGPEAKRAGFLPAAAGPARIAPAWRPAEWHLRSTSTTRRHSGDAGEMHARFFQRARRSRRVFRRRKSFSSGAIELAAYQSQQLMYLRESAQKRSCAPSPAAEAPPTFRRSRSAVTPPIERALSGCEQRTVNRNACTVRQASVLSGNCEVWPENTTGLLTGVQLVIDRSILLAHLNDDEGAGGAGGDRAGSPSGGCAGEGSGRTDCLPNSGGRCGGRCGGQSGGRSGGRGGGADSAGGAAPAGSAGVKLKCGGMTIPRYDKVRGEDSFFISDEFLGVADGVGEWGELGCDPRDFADQLMQGAKDKAKELAREERGAAGGGGSGAWVDGSLPPPRCSFASPSARGAAADFDASCRFGGGRGGGDVGGSPGSRSQDALACLAAGFERAVAYGSSTALVVGLRGRSGELGIANLGDSTCLVLRRDSSQGWRYFVPLRRTREQQHFFNCPYQLSHVPKVNAPAAVAAAAGGGGGGAAAGISQKFARALAEYSAHVDSDTPAMADLYDLQVRPGDLILAGTDGVFDNLFDQELAALVSFAISPHEAAALACRVAAPRGGLSPHPHAILPPVPDPEYGLATPPQNIAQAVAEAAFLRSHDPRARTPFARQSRRAGGYFYGGKLDDITVVAAWVVAEGELEAQRETLAKCPFLAAS